VEDIMFEIYSNAPPPLFGRGGWEVRPEGEAIL